MRHRLASACCVLALLSVGQSAFAETKASPVGDATAGALDWRLLGPFRAGWAEMIDGSPLKPDLFVMAAAGGGV